MDPTPQAESRQLFLQGMSHAACTVSIVTTDGPAGRAGVTVSAMSSVSADGPAPTLLACVHHQSPAAAALVANGVFCVNVLRDDQAYISDTFAGRRKMADGDKFSCAQWEAGSTGAPKVVNPLVTFDCRLDKHFQVGTHLVLFGAVQETSVGRHGSPLIYANRAYGTPAHFPNFAPTLDPTANEEGLRIGVYTSFAPYVLPSILQRMHDAGMASPLRILEGDQRQVASALRDGAIDVALTYDLELDASLETEWLGSLSPYALLPARHPLAAKVALSLGDLANEPYVLYDIAPSREYFLSLFAGAGISPRIAYRSSSFEMVRGLVAHGLGYSVLATKPANSMSYDGQALVSRPLVDTDLAASRIVVARVADARLSAATKNFIEVCKAHFQSQP